MGDRQAPPSSAWPSQTFCQHLAGFPEKNLKLLLIQYSTVLNVKKVSKKVSVM